MDNENKQQTVSDPLECLVSELYVNTKINGERI